MGKPLTTAIRFWTNRKLRFLAVAVIAGLLQLLLLATPSFSTERIYVSLGPLERSILVADLATFAHTGELSNELQPIGRFLSPEQLEQFRAGLLVSANIDVVTVSQFLYTAQGEAVLKWLGEFIQTEGRLNAGLAVRGATILAAADADGGLNILNFLKHFPTPGVRLDLGPVVRIGRTVINEVNQTNDATVQIFEQADVAASDMRNSTSADKSVRNLILPGTNRWELRSLEDTTLPTDLYLPEGQSFPLVVMSHGLGGNRGTLAYLAEHLASHGLAVAVVEHPGSSDDQISALLSGQIGEVVEPAEMTRRPLDIHVLLDELEALVQDDPTLGSRMDLQRVAVVGQSMGGYTSLAMAGATFDLDTLEKSCPPQITQLNLSLLLQCLVPLLPQPLPPLQDERVRAAIAINPLDSAVFGPSGMANIDIPVMVVSGSADTVTPALAEQIRPFTWLNSPERYLLLVENGTHFSAIHNPQGGEATAISEQVIGPNPELAQDYIRAMGLAFLKTHLAEEDAYQLYLDPAYAATLSRSDLPLALIRELTLEE
ncbi:MAG: alpha/beta fold hydrolase [Cyanobacteria bacterium P01_D01_bin.2]